MSKEYRVQVVYCPKPGGVTQSAYLSTWTRQTIDQVSFAKSWCAGRDARYVALINESQVCVDVGFATRGELHDIEECGAVYYSPRAVRDIYDIAGQDRT